MTASVHSLGTVLWAIAANPSGKMASMSLTIAFFLIIETASFDNFALFVTYV